MNIQIDNPISILNQDISRTFLVSSSQEEKYELFMKATLLDVIGHNYKEAELICQQEYEKLKQYNEVCLYYSFFFFLMIALFHTYNKNLYRFYVRQEKKLSSLKQI